MLHFVTLRTSRPSMHCNAKRGPFNAVYRLMFVQVGEEIFAKMMLQWLGAESEANQSALLIELRW